MKSPRSSKREYIHTPYTPNRMIRLTEAQRRVLIEALEHFRPTIDTQSSKGVLKLADLDAIDGMVRR
jgi:hypothetical protein